MVRFFVMLVTIWRVAVEIAVFFTRPATESFRRYRLRLGLHRHIGAGGRIILHGHHLLDQLARHRILHHHGHLLQLGLHLDRRNRLSGLDDALHRLDHRLRGLLDRLDNRLGRLLYGLHDRLSGLLYGLHNGLGGLFNRLHHRLGRLFHSLDDRLGGFGNRLGGLRRGSHAFDLLFHIRSGCGVKYLECLCHVLLARCSPAP